MTDSGNARTGELHAGGGGWEWEGEERELERARVVYRLYATLYFVFVVDGAESELGVLDLIQVSLRVGRERAGRSRNRRGRCLQV